MRFYINNDEICIKHDGFCIKTVGLCIKTVGFCIKTTKAVEAEEAVEETERAARAERTRKRGDHFSEKGAAPATSMKTPAARAFDRYDSDANGVLNRHELTAMVQDARVPGSSVVEKMFEKFDEDNSGGIDLAEFRVLWTQYGLGQYVQDTETGAEEAGVLHERLLRGSSIYGRLGVTPPELPSARVDGSRRGSVGRGLEAQNTATTPGGSARGGGSSHRSQALSGRQNIAIAQLDYGANAAIETSLAPPPDWAEQPPAARSGSGSRSKQGFDSRSKQGDHSGKQGDHSGGAAVRIPPPPHEPASSQGDDAVSELFNRYNANGDGILDMTEVKEMLMDVNYEVNESYLNGLADLFGRFDSDGSGGVELEEFRNMYDQLQLDQYTK